ncbi:MAG TPA: chemotaxis protein CheW, partial [Spirochaetia bacterium]|nr:chemotaxis protein CheW [Spirochaetia bacterium]
MSPEKTEGQQKVNESVEQKKEHTEKIDFKMVTFALAGKEYGIDIMNVKEIARASKFTYVPNAAPFVRGVYNLRGDIISIIDLRTMFHLPAERKGEDILESLIILKVDDNVFGVIVDSIDKVIGVSSANIQPPHPIFGDINVKYIKGIIENNGKLYIILNIEKLFTKEEEIKSEKNIAPVALSEQALEKEQSNYVINESNTTDLVANFIKETLYTYKHFAVTPVNETWFNARYEEWKSIKKNQDLQLKEASEADEFLSTFFSPYTSALWADEYAQAVINALPDLNQKIINVWNPGCGKGYETYSFACVLKKRYPDARIKIWANDSDLLAISMAPNMIFMVDDVPEIYKEFMIKGKNGWTFVQSIRDSIFFEFHDVLNSNPLPPLDM